jgi:hypothetical protein
MVFGGVPLALAVLAAFDGALVAAGILLVVGLLVVARWVVEAGQAVGTVRRTLREEP